VCGGTSGAGLGYGPMTPRIDPEPAEEVREAILAALAGVAQDDGSWSAAALLEGVEDELDP
jgi:hypothetical protein